MKLITKKLFKVILNFYKESVVTVPWPVVDVRDLGVKSYRRKHTVIDAYNIKKVI